MDVGGWLRKLGLGHYEAAFRENKIDDTVLPSLTAEDVKDLGVGFVGDRRKLLDAIAALRAGAIAPTPLSDAPLATDKAAKDSAERRQVTVMFSDLVGSTALSARLDLEDLREVISAYQMCVADTVRRFGGFVARYMGDGVLIYFGYPAAHEDDAERAVRAGLALVDAVATLPAPEPVQVRVGAATGMVVVGDLVGSGKGQARDIVGETPNLAARLQAIAEPNTVAIAEATRNLLGNLFELRDLGPKELKGITGPVKAFAVLRAGSVESRFEAMHAGGMTALVGREEELELLLRRWARAKTGEGQAVLLSGEAGIGKSRLSAALMEDIAAEPHTRLRYFCSPQHTDSAFYPVIAQLERAAGFEKHAPPEIKLDKLVSFLGSSPQAASDIQLLAELLSVPTGDRYPPLNWSPQRKKEKTFEALLRQHELLTHRQPVLMIFEDVHWIDPSSRELLDLTLERVQRLPVLLLITFRPEFQPPWVGLPHVTMHPLSRLDRRDGASLVQRVAENKGLPDAIVDEIVTRADGVPLFVEELTKAVLETGEDAVIAEQIISATPPASHMVPATLHASLMARLDRLGLAAKEVAQIGAAIGREFSFDLMASVARRSKEELLAALDQLVDAGLVFRRGTPPQATFLFKHALVQEAAYNVLLRGQRQELHTRIARVLEQEFPGDATVPELLAHHFAEAGLAEAAVENWLKAGRLAIAHSATAEAEAQLTRALELLATLPDGPTRRRQELDVQVALGGALISVKGYAATETGRAYARARELCRKVGEIPQLFPVLFGQAVIHMQRAEHFAALEVSEELLRLAERQEDPARVLVGHRVVGASLFHLGRFAGARDHLERTLSLYNPERDRALAFHWAHDQRVTALCWLSWTLCVLGYPDQAMARSSEALADARALGHLPTLAYALVWNAIIWQLRRQHREARAASAELMSLATEQRFPLWQAAAMIVGGWAQAVAGDSEAGSAQLRHGLAGWQATGAEGWLPYHLGVAADVCWRAGQADEALNLTLNALARAENTAAHWFEAELHRLRGELLIANSDRKEGTRCLLRALRVAREQNAKMWELRASTCLARLWRDQGKRNAASELLAPVYGWFTEGFDTIDLKEAKALLDLLAS
ncbi:SAM domain (Sterile alpha motif) [Bradyrhizobium erythrophlei]|nr:SAM domain (Sterile alpha motif) [Bradyrhizobium erythrophlei]